MLQLQLLLLPPLLLFALRPADGKLRGQIAQPDYTYYHTTDQVFAMYESYAAAGCPAMKVQRVSDASGSYRVDNSMVVTVTGPGTGPKVGVAIGFGEHGRELISAEIGMRLLAMLCAPWAESPGVKLPAALASHHALALKGLALHKRNLNWVTALLDRVAFKLLPVENPNGRRIVEGGKLCHRMNGRKVDINRNFDFKFGIHPPEYLPSEEYEGTAAFSEPEARITRDAVKSLMTENAGGVHAFVAIHAGIKEMYLPYDYKLEEAPGADLHAVLDKINSVHCRCRSGSSASIGGYKAFGTATAYMYEALNIKYVYTWEVVGDLTASARDCFRGFNPITHSSYEDEVQNWSAALLMLADEVAARELPPASSLSIASGAGTGMPPAQVTNAGPVPVKNGAVPSFDPSRPDANPGPRNNAELG